MNARVAAAARAILENATIETGRLVRTGQAKAQGILHELATDRDDMLAKAKAWCSACSADALRRWSPISAARKNCRRRTSGNCAS